jgi:hypothetical protein
LLGRSAALDYLAGMQGCVVALSIGEMPDLDETEV